MNKSERISKKNIPDRNHHIRSNCTNMHKMNGRKSTFRENDESQIYPYYYSEQLTNFLRKETKKTGAENRN